MSAGWHTRYISNLKANFSLIRCHFWALDVFEPINYVFPISENTIYRILTWEAAGPYLHMHWNPDKAIYVFYDSEFDNAPRMDIMEYLGGLPAKRWIVVNYLESLEFRPDGIGLFEYTELKLLHRGTMARRIQRAFRIYLEKKRDRAARIIQKGCQNWIDRPVTKGGKLGIACRLISKLPAKDSCNSEKNLL